MSSLKKHIRIAKRNSIITPRLHAWLSAHPDGIKTDNDQLLAKVTSILAPSEHDRSGSFHPSQLYQCPRAQIFGYYGVPTTRSYNPTLQNLFNDGHFRHLRWQVMLMEAGIITDIEVPVEIPKYRLTGSMDGYNAVGKWMFELKGTSQFQQVMQRGAMPAHIKQVHAYMLAADVQTAIIVYECKSSQQWIEIEVQRDEAIVAEITEILEGLNHAIDSGDMPEVLDDCKNQEGPTYNGCAYASICLGIKSTGQVVALLPPKRRASNDQRNAARTRRVRRGSDGAD